MLSRTSLLPVGWMILFDCLAHLLSKLQRSTFNMDCHVQPQTLPYDILAIIADQLALDRESFTDRPALQALSQTCKLMVPMCRRHLFSSISLSGYAKVEYQDLLKLLQEKREIASYVRELRYRISPHPSEYEDGILGALLRYSTSLGASSPLCRISLTFPCFSGLGQCISKTSSHIPDSITDDNRTSFFWF